MAVSVTMPRLGESVSEGTVTRWLKQEGEQVEADEPLLEVSTDKVDTEIPAPASGVLQSIKVAEDETVEVGVELAVIGDAADSDGGGEAPQQEAEPEQDQTEQAEQEPAAEEEPEQPEPEPEPAPTRASQPESEPESESEPETEPEPKSEPEPARAQQAAPSSGGGTGDGQSSEPSSNGEAPYVTPLVRRLAAEHNVDLGSVTGTGVGGRIRKQDVLDAAAQGGAREGGEQAAQSAPARSAPAQQPDTEPSGPAPQIEEPQAAKASGPQAPGKASEPSGASADTPVRGRTEKLSRLRSVIAKRMVESLHISAQLTTVVEVDVTKIARLRERAKTSFEAREGVKLSFLPFFAIATCEALKQHPKVNASIDLEQGTVTYHEAEHLGVAVDTERGLLVPVIHDAGDLNLGGMARKIADLAERTRRNEVTPDELGGGTFTLTNTGSRGALFDTPIINQPQVGILGTGTVVKRPEVVDHPDLGEVIAVRSSLYLALTYDHRIVDGADAARFLTTIKTRLEDGAFEGDLGL